MLLTTIYGLLTSHAAIGAGPGGVYIPGGGGTNGGGTAVFNSNQFDTNAAAATIKSGVNLTNVVIYGEPPNHVAFSTTNGVAAGRTGGADTLLISPGSGGFAGGDFTGSTHVTNSASESIVIGTFQNASNLNVRGTYGSHTGVFLENATNIFAAAAYGSWLGIAAPIGGGASVSDSILDSGYGSHLGLRMGGASNIIARAEAAVVVLDLNTSGTRVNVTVMATNSLVVGQPPSNSTNTFSNQIAIIGPQPGLFTGVQLSGGTNTVNSLAINVLSNGVSKWSVDTAGNVQSGTLTTAGSATFNAQLVYQTNNANTFVGMKLGNANAGNNAEVFYSLTSQNGTASLELFSSSFSSTGYQRKLLLSTDGGLTGGIALQTVNASAPITFAANHAAGDATADLTLSPSHILTSISNIVSGGSIIATNLFSLPTNYVAANFVPIAGMVNIVSSNGALFSVTQRSTNLIAGP